MPAVPVGASVAASRRSMPSPVQSVRASCAPRSPPSAQTNDVAAPARRDAIAWLNPLPPGPLAYSPVSVAPGCGSVGTRHTWSTLNEPTTATRAVVVARSATERAQHAGDGRRHERGDRAAEHRAQAEPGEVSATFRRKPADAA